MMLVNEEGRDANQEEPSHTKPAQQRPRPQVPPVHVPEQRAQTDVHGREQVVRLVEGVERREQDTEPSADRRTRPTVTQRKQEKPGRRESDGQRDPPRVHAQFGARAAQEKRPGKEQVDGHVWQDHHRHEGDVPFPLEEERPDVGPVRGEGVAPAVDQEKSRSQQSEPESGGKPWAARGGTVHFLRASETVKIPQRSISMAVFSKPAWATSASISAWVRRRMTQGWPSRLGRTRAIISICGCQGWLV